MEWVKNGGRRLWRFLSEPRQVLPRLGVLLKITLPYAVLVVIVVIVAILSSPTFLAQSNGG
jgi:hypothetical protein